MNLASQSPYLGHQPLPSTACSDAKELVVYVLSCVPVIAQARDLSRPLAPPRADPTLAGPGTRRCFCSRGGLGDMTADFRAAGSLDPVLSLPTTVHLVCLAAVFASEMATE